MTWSQENRASAASARRGGEPGPGLGLVVHRRSSAPERGRVPGRHQACVDVVGEDAAAICGTSGAITARPAARYSASFSGE